MTPVVARFIAQHTPPCQRVAQLLSDGMERRLSLRQQVVLRLHLVICICCERYRRQLQVLRILLRRISQMVESRPLPAIQLSTDARERITQALRRANAL